MTAPKAALGHGLGAAGAFGVVVAALVLHHGVVPPTRNLEDADPRCALDHVAGQPRTVAAGRAMVNASGFGGQNAAVVLGAWTGNG